MVMAMQAAYGFSSAQTLRKNAQFPSCQMAKPLTASLSTTPSKKAARSRQSLKVQSLFGWGSSTTVEEEVYYDDRVTVAKVQVGLLGSARELQTDLEKMAEDADTESPEGLHYILQETVLALMRNPEYCIYGHSTGVALTDSDRAEGRFNEYSMEERGKFQMETRSNVEGRSRRGELKSSPAGGGPQELIVVTIIVAADGAWKLPKIQSRTDLKAALAKIGSVSPDDLLAVEVLWTPEQEGDYFTQHDLACDYPLLNTL